MPITITPIDPSEAVKLKKAIFGDQDITQLPQYKHCIDRADYLSRKVYRFNQALLRDPKIKWWDFIGKISWMFGKKAIRVKIIPDFEKVAQMYIKASHLPIKQMVNISDLEFDRLIKNYSTFIKSNNAIFGIKGDEHV